VIGPVPPDERISAYLDGDLSPAEHAEVQKLLVSSALWRTELDQISWVRVTVRALPAQAAPPGLFEHLLREGLEAPGPQQAAPIPLRPRTHPARASRAVRWVGSAAAAAAIVVAALLMPSRGSVTPSVPEVADSHAVRSSITDDPVMQLANISSIMPFGR
jgi:anti-sigma factor RsiW